MQTLKANGKLLISGEYAVIDGALALAIPTRFGQNLTVSYSEKETEFPILYWEAFLHNQEVWFTAEWELKSLKLLKTSHSKLAGKLNKILLAIEQLKPNFFNDQNQDIRCSTTLDFPKNWGLGSSSTLISLLAQWIQLDAFELNRLTFQTSGYDIACAEAKTPIFYQRKNEKPMVEDVQLSSKITENLFFVHLNQKQDTQKSVTQHYKNVSKDKDWLNLISTLTYNISRTESKEEFEILVIAHEEIIASKIGLPKVKDVYFPDYEGIVKSLGAWGGDFVMITAHGDFKNYFRSKGFTTILSFNELFGQI